MLSCRGPARQCEFAAHTLTTAATYTPTAGGLQSSNLGMPCLPFDDLAHTSSAPHFLPLPACSSHIVRTPFPSTARLQLNAAVRSLPRFSQYVPYTRNSANLGAAALVAPPADKETTKHVSCNCCDCMLIFARERSARNRIGKQEQWICIRWIYILFLRCRHMA